MKIYTVTHKPFDFVLPKDYAYIQVNAANSNRFEDVTDADGDNISDRNYCYCELTAQYWIWKNYRGNDIVGLTHYRRFFAKSRFTTSSKGFLTAEMAEKILSKYDIIVTNPYQTKINVLEHLSQDVSGEDIELLRQTIEELCPDYSQTLEKVLSGRETYLLNMFVMRKDLLDKYCSWLFNILFALEKKIDMTNYTTSQKRVLGYMAERLMTVYVRHNHLKAYSMPVYLVGVNKIDIAIDKAKRLPNILMGKISDLIR